MINMMYVEKGLFIKTQRRKGVGRVDLQLNSRLPVYLRLHWLHLSIYLVTVVMGISCAIARATDDNTCTLLLLVTILLM